MAQWFRQYLGSLCPFLECLLTQLFAQVHAGKAADESLRAWVLGTYMEQDQVELLALPEPNLATIDIWEQISTWKTYLLLSLHQMKVRSKKYLKLSKASWNKSTVTSEVANRNQRIEALWMWSATFLIQHLIHRTVCTMQITMHVRRPALYLALSTSAFTFPYLKVFDAPHCVISLVTLEWNHTLTKWIHLNQISMCSFWTPTYIINSWGHITWIRILNSRSRHHLVLPRCEWSWREIHCQFLANLNFISLSLSGLLH